MLIVIVDLEVDPKRLIKNMQAVNETARQIVAANQNKLHKQLMEIKNGNKMA